MHNHTCGCGHHGGEAQGGSPEHHGEGCACEHGHAEAAPPLAPAWSMLGSGVSRKSFPPEREFDFLWEGQPIHVYQWGSPENVPVVLLHGFMQSGLSWENVVESLLPGHCVYALDFLGHGKSAKPRTAELYAYDASVRMVESFLEEVACLAPDGSKRRAHVVGYSMGGRIALGLASSEKDLLYSLVLESCNFGPDGEEERIVAEERNRAWASKLRSSGIEAFVGYWEALPLFQTQCEMGLDEVIRPERLANDAEAMALCLEGAGKHAMPDAAQSFAVVASTWIPVKYLWGYDDRNSEPVAHRLEHGGIDVTSFGTGHNVHLEAPALYGTVVQEFLSGIEPKGLAFGTSGHQR